MKFRVCDHETLFPRTKGELQDGRRRTFPRAFVFGQCCAFLCTVFVAVIGPSRTAPHPAFSRSIPKAGDWQGRGGTVFARNYVRMIATSVLNGVLLRAHLRLATVDGPVASRKKNVTHRGDVSSTTRGRQHHCVIVRDHDLGLFFFAHRWGRGSFTELHSGTHKYQARRAGGKFKRTHRYIQSTEDARRTLGFAKPKMA